MKIYKKWLKYSFILIMLIVLAVTIFNYKVDSLGLFGDSNYLSKASKDLINGNIISGLENYDDRLFQSLIIKNIKIKNDVIAIGSSRMMQLRKRFFLDEKINFFNHSVAGASLEDYISIIGAYEMISGYIPATVILGIDPWVFNKHNGQKRWKSLDRFYHNEINKIHKNKCQNVNDINILKWKQLFNYDYTISNIKFLKSIIKNKGESFNITNTIEVNSLIKEPDGSIHYPSKQRNPSSKQIEDAARAYASGKVYSLEGFYALSNTKLFEKFIKYLQENGSKVIFFLPPYNPVSYDIIIKNEKYKNIKVAEEYLKKFAKKNKIKLIGSYNPHKYDFKSNDFFDGMHGNEIVYKTLFKKEDFHE